MNDLIDAIVDRIAGAISGWTREPEYEIAWLVARTPERPAAPVTEPPADGCGRSWV